MARPSRSKRRPASQPSAARDRFDARVADLYESLRKVAHRAVQARTGARVLDPTELVHECYLKLAKSHSLGELPQPEFLALAATAIRTVLVDHARQLNAVKRGGRLARVTLDGKDLAERKPLDLIDLDAALTELAALDPRMARIVELRFFGGLPMRDVAKTLGIGERTADTDWALAKAWLHRELGQ
jgi:RNA polymerase sigma-70 factor, ECF subfamily